MSSRIALVVEDDPSTRVLLLLLLSRLPDVSVIAASSVAEGKALAGAVRFDVAVLDLVLGDGTGFEVLEKLRGDNRPDCVVLASAYIERFRGTVQIEPNVVAMNRYVCTYSRA